MIMNLLDAALAYAEKGFSVIPIQSDKKPFLKWESCQKRRSTPEEIREWWSKWPSAMVGIVTGAISGISVIDVDESQGHEELQKYVPDSLLMPTAMTPRGGQHLYFKTPSPSIGNNARIIPGCDFRGEGGYVVAPPSTNGTGKAYTWLPGLSLQEIEPPPLPAAYLCYIDNNNAWGGYRGGNRGDVTQNVTLFKEGRRDNDLFHVANTLAKGGMPEKEILQVLERLADSCTPPFPKGEIKVKIESALKRSARREINLTEEVRNWISVTNGNFSVTDCYKELQTITGVTNRNIYRVVLHRLSKEGLIEKSTERDGIFRLIQNECKDIDFLNVVDVPLAIHFPFQVERYVKILPKNIIIIAGEPNTGKTAYLLNFSRLNMKEHKVHYFSSEMGALELRDRLTKFEMPLNQWKFSAKERSSNFADVIHPDDINVVDFLEMTDEFYRVGGLIKEIFDKLQRGVAFIAIQKNRGTDYGLGGMRSLEKARLYLAMESGKIKIVKAKNWASQVNPNGLELDFKLIQGCKFQPGSDWHKVS